MFYNATENSHGLPHDPFKALVAPRPIGWISTVDGTGRPNLAPYSFFNIVSSNPHIVMFSSSGRKHTVSNIEATGEFVCNLAIASLMREVNETSAPLPPGASEFAHAGLTPLLSVMVRPPRVAEAPAALECRALRVEELRDLDGRGTAHWMVLGQVVGIHIDDRAIVDGRVALERLRPLSRLGYLDYGAIDELTPLPRPTANGALA